jgi:hypothetical protein
VSNSKPYPKRLEELKQSILGLVMACPFDQKNPSGCQLCEIRKLDLKLRYQWVSSLTIEEAEAIWATHEKCMISKECHGA